MFQIMEKLKELGWQKVLIIAAVLELVLGIVFGAIFKSVPAGIITGILSAAITGFVLFALCGNELSVIYEVKNTQLFQAPQIIAADPLNKRRWYPATLMLMRV